MKKIICLFLCAFFALSLLSSCSDTPITATPSPTVSISPSPSAPKTERYIPDKLETGYDFDGAEINFIMCGDNNVLRSIHLPEGDDETNIANVCTAFRNKQIKKVLNINIGKSLVVSPVEMTEYMRVFFTSPNKEFDIVGAYERYDLGLAYSEEEQFIDFNTIEEKDMHMDLDAPYWDQNANEALAFNGKNYWVTGDISYERIRNTLVSFVNKQLWLDNADKIRAAIGYDDLYKLVCDGKWTYEAVSKLGGISMFATGSVKNTFPSILMSGEGITFSNGIEKSDFNADALVDFQNAVRLIFSDNGIFKNEIIDRFEKVTPVEKFAKGSSLITFGRVNQSESLVNMKEDYYIAPLPKSSESQPYRTSSQGFNNVFGVLKSCENVSAATATLEIMAYSAKELQNLEYVLSSVPLCYCHDSDDMKDLAIYSINNVEYVTDIAISCEDMLDEGITVFVNHNIFNDDFKSLLIDKKASFESEFEKILEAFK